MIASMSSKENSLLGVVLGIAQMRIWFAVCVCDCLILAYRMRLNCYSKSAQIQR